MSNLTDKFTFHGKLYEVEPDGTLVKLVRSDNLKAGEGISITADPDNGDNVIVETNLGIKIVDGLLCTTFEE